ncbi:hypothetical protein CEXT_388451 [Caerostris extrusa]|uniref:Uncharacterized protein n=1 Tax=Caerostris extrusa TaxID=172846 RepID=A0AAV4WB65_CAEEX|nr:hypothetical protein CEXT_388451 [Caerostris extrusa]
MARVLANWPPKPARFEEKVKGPTMPIPDPPPLETFVPNYGGTRGKCSVTTSFVHSAPLWGMLHCLCALFVMLHSLCTLDNALHIVIMLMKGE